MSEIIQQANLKNFYGLRKGRDAYTGPCVNVRRVSDNATQDIGFVSGYFDTAAYATFIGASTGRVVTFYDQAGSKNLTQGTAAQQPEILQRSPGRWVIRFNQTASQALENNTAFGTYTNISVNVMWAAPTSLAGYSNFVSGIDLGNDLEFIAPWWTSQQSQYSRHGAGENPAWSNYDDGQFRQHLFHFANGTASTFEFGAPSTAPVASRPNPSLNRIRVGRTAFSYGSFDLLEFSIHDSLVNATSLADNIVSNYSTFLNNRNINLAIGDSNLITAYCGLGNLWTRRVWRRTGETSWFTQGQGGSTLLDWTSRVSNFAYYLTLPKSQTNSTAIIALGTNDLFFGASPATTYSRAVALCNALKALGFARVFISTVFHRTQAAPFNANRIAYNNLLLNDTSNTFTGVIDTTTNALLEDSSNTEFFTDGVHLSAAGQAEYAACITNALLGRFSNPGAANVTSDAAYFVNGVWTSGQYVKPSTSNVKIGTSFGNSQTGIYDGSDRWSDPGVENVFLGTTYEADNETLVGEFDPLRFSPNFRYFVNDILRFIDAETLTDVEFGTIESTNKEYTQQLYNELFAILQSRGDLSDQEARLGMYFKSKGISISEATESYTNILVGGSVED